MSYKELATRLTLAARLNTWNMAHDSVAWKETLDEAAAILRSLDAQEPVATAPLHISSIHHLAQKSGISVLPREGDNPTVFLTEGCNGVHTDDFVSAMRSAYKLGWSDAAPVAAQPRELTQDESAVLRGAIFDSCEVVAAQPTELEELRKRVKDFPLDDQDVPIIYDTNEIDLITYALTGDDGEDDSVTVLQRLVRALPGKTVYALLEDAETAAQPQQAKPLSEEWRTRIVRANKKYHDSDEVDPYGVIDDVEAAHGIKEHP